MMSIKSICWNVSKQHFMQAKNLMLANISKKKQNASIKRKHEGFMEEKEKKNKSKSIGGNARAKALPPGKRSEIAKKAADSRWSADIVRATHESYIKLGDLEIECAVLDNEKRVISERAMTRAFGGKRGGSHWKRVKKGESNLPVYLSAKNYTPFIDADLAEELVSPIRYRTQHGNVGNGMDATLLPKICNVLLKARDAGALHPSQIPLAIQADIIMRGLATVGIIALIDEATGFQKDRAKDALTVILEAFIAKELQPWLKTFPSDFYQEMFRLRGLPYPTTSVNRPQYFGRLTNNIVYDRLAPGVREELQKGVPRNDSGRPTAKYFQKLTQNTGYPKLREHLGSIVMLMKLSTSWDDFMRKLDQFHPKFGSTISLDLDEDI
jgi:hypothetical protein